MEFKKYDNSFYVGDDHENPLAEITYYEKDEKTLVIEHTFVSDSLRGQGVGGALVREVALLARAEGKKIIPHCSYAKRVMIQNPDYQDVLTE